MDERDDYADGPTQVHWVHSPYEWAILALLLTGIAALSALPGLIAMFHRVFG
jgi:hypothetical protein